MDFFKRATTSILRRPGKTMILLLLVFILGSVIAGAISVRGAINNTDANLRARMRPIVSIRIDQAASFDWDELEALTSTHIRAIGDLPYVDFYDYTISVGLSSFELEPYWPDYLVIPEYIATIGEREEGIPALFSVRGTSSTDLVQIEQGIINLIPGGRQFAEHELSPGAERSVALIPQGVADTNNLTVGSIFELYLFVHDPSLDVWVWECPECFADENIYERISMEFEVIGLLETPFDFDPASADLRDWTKIDTLNTFYIPNWAIEDMLRRQIAAQLSAFEYFDMEDPWFFDQYGDGEHGRAVLPLFVLENPADMEVFKVTAEPLLPNFWEFEAFPSTFDAIASSMESMQTIADWVLYVSIGATLLISSLLITLFLRDRRYEMGVYLALGEKKGKIISQILLEVVVTSVIGITLAVFVGSLTSGMISQNMLRNELVAQAEVANDQWSGNWQRDHSVFNEIGVPRTNMTVDEMMDAFDISLSIQTVGLFYAVGLGAVVLSTVIPVLYVVKLNPKKVLL